MTLAMDHTPPEPREDYFLQLAEWASRLTVDHVPSSVIDILKDVVKDGLSCGIFGSTLAWTRIVVDALSDQRVGSGSVTVWGTAERMDGLAAALANAVAVQAYELDDFHNEGSLHGASCMLPAVMALAEIRKSITGGDLLSALATGWEVAIRVNRCLGDVLPAGYHAPTMIGTIAAATAAGRALRLPPDQMAHCIALGVLQVSGLAVVQFGGMAKRLYAGRAAEAGLQVALLAERGFTAPADVLSNPYGGLLSTYGKSRRADLSLLTKDLGQEYAASGIVVKLYSCCGAMQPALQLLVDLMAERPDVTADNIADIAIFLTPATFAHVGFPYQPGSVTEAQFSVEYTLAVYLLERSAFIDQYREELLADPRVMELVERISVKEESVERGDPLLTRRAARLVVRLKDGGAFSREGSTAAGYPGRPVSERELYAKYSRLVRDSLSTEEAQALWAECGRVEDFDDISGLAFYTVPRATGERSALSAVQEF